MIRKETEPTHLIYKCNECGLNIRLPIRPISSCPECGAVYSIQLPMIRYISRINNVRDEK